MTPVQNERAERVAAAKEFWAALSETRQKDPFSGEDESLRSWARRMGVDVANLLQWERGGGVTPKVIRKICNSLGLPESEFFRLLSLSDPSIPPYTPVHSIPVYDPNKTRVQEDGGVLGEKVSSICLTPSVIRDANASRRIIAFRLPPDMDEMEPILEVGSYVLVDMAEGQMPKTFVNGGLYAVGLEEGGVVFRYLKYQDGALWMFTEVPGVDEKAWTGVLSRLVIGRVFFQQRQIRKVA